MVNWKGILKGSGKVAHRDRRVHRRQRTRLRPGKVVSDDRRFLADCAIIDRSPSGLRLRAFDDFECPDDGLMVFDENEGLMHSGKIAWRRQAEMGIRFDGEARSPERDVLRRLTNPYYALGD